LTYSPKQLLIIL